MNSILISVKKTLGIEPEYAHFDPDITLNINSALLTLNQLGIGPEGGFIVTGEAETWTDLLGNRTDLEAAKTLIYLKVRLLFDPPTSSFVLDAIERQIAQIEWRLSIQVETQQVIEEVVPDEG